MKNCHFRNLAFILIAAIAGSAWPVARAQEKPQVDQERVAAAVARLLESAHYSRRKLDDELSKDLLENYLKSLDYNRLYFTQGDVQEFRQKYATSLDNAILSGDLSPAYEIYGRFKQRVLSRVEKNKALARNKFSFTSDEAVEINRQKSEWPQDEAEADKLWAARIEAELLQEHLNETRIDPPEKVITRRYDQVLRNLKDQEEEDIIKVFLSSLAQSYDPHSEYLSPSDMENFKISMQLSLVGVGAVLKSEDGYAKVMEVVAGGPADKDGRLKVNDRIAGVAQGKGEFEDVVDLKLDKVVEKIRGKKDTTVRLSVIPASATDPSQRKIIEIVRDEVELKDAAAKAELIEIQNPEGEKSKLGWITLPTFYADMDRNRSDGKEPRSTTEDVKKLLARLKMEGIEGLVIDLRRDGGGSLEEAINMTGLFIGNGPVVQAKDASGKVTVNYHRDSEPFYNGPLVVLVNRLSASASEIFAAALQDYGRAVIVGDQRSFGKGTVQTLYEVGRAMAPFFSLNTVNAGAVKVTIQKFYRVKGGSTQQKGVESDIVLPSLYDREEIGESALDNPLPHDWVSPVKFNYIGSVTPLIEELRLRSAERIATDPEFAYVREDMERIREKWDRNTISLNKEKRKAELAAEKARKESRKVERLARKPDQIILAYDLPLEKVDAPKLELVDPEKNKKTAKAKAQDGEEESEESSDVDPIRVEGIRILQDVISLAGGKAQTTKTVLVSPEKNATP